MQIVDLVIKNGKVATPVGLIKAGIAVDEGKIIAIAKDTNLPRSDLSIDMKGKIAIPGIIDSHVHICMPERLCETFETGTRAAAAGGVTTVIEMPSLGRWLTTTMENLQWKRKTGEEQALIDFALYGGEIQDERDLKEINDLAKEGVVGFKITMGGGTAVKNDGILIEAMHRISESGSIMSVHAENNQLLDHFKRELISEGRRDLLAHADSRPNIVEAEAVSRAILYSEQMGG